MEAFRLKLFALAMYAATYRSTAFCPHRQEYTRTSTQRPVSASSSNEFSSGSNAASQASAYLESISNALNEEDLEQLQVEERIKLMQERRQAGSFTVTLPLKNMGMSIVQVLPGRRLVPKQLDLDALDQVVLLDAAACKEMETSWLQQLDASFRGLVVSSVSESSLAAKQGIRSGTILKAASATLGEAVWPKSTLEGVQAALQSRRMTASEVIVSCSNQAVTFDNRYELALTKPIGMLLQEKDGHVIVTGVTDQASTLVQHAVQIGDRVVAVDSTFGGKLWPASTVEGVVSACTSRLPGQNIRIILERPQENMVAAADATIASEANGNARNGATSVSVAVKSAAIAAANPTMEDQRKLLRRCRDVLKRYSKAKLSKLDKYKLPAMVADKVVDALASASATVDATTLSMIMTAYLSCEQPTGAMKAFEAATGFAADGSTNPLVDIVLGRDGGMIVPNESSLNLYTATALLQAHAMKDDIASVSRVLAALEGRSGVDIEGIESAPWPWTGTYGTLHPDTTCYNIAIAATERVGGLLALETALDIFDRMEQTTGAAKDCVSFNTIISILSNAGEYEKAFRMFEQMKELGILPDKYTYTSLLKACSQDGDMDEIMYDMRARGIHADVVTYNTALQRLCGDRKFTQATKLVTEMESRGVRPDSMTYGMLMNAMLKAKKANACLTLFESASSNPRTSGLTENVYLYTTAITAASMLGDYERALELVARMSANGIAPNLKTLTSVMGACLASDQAELAAQLYRRITNPDGYALTQGIKAYCGAGDLKAAVAIVKTQCRDNVMSGKQVMQSYGTILDAALRTNAFDVARDTVKDFLHQGYIFNKSILFSMTDVLLTEDENDEEKFAFCLFVMDALRKRNLPVEGCLYSTLLTLGHRLGGLPRRLASLVAQSKTAAGTKAQRFLSTVEEVSAGAVKVVYLQDLLAEPRLLEGEVVLPPLPVRIAPADIQAIFRAERLVWSESKRRRVLV